MIMIMKMMWNDDDVDDDGKDDTVDDNDDDDDDDDVSKCIHWVALLIAKKIKSLRQPYK